MANAVRITYSDLEVDFQTMMLAGSICTASGSRMVSNARNADVWYLLTRIRAAMTRRNEQYTLSSVVKMDDAYLGWPKRDGKRGRGTEKAKIVVALSLDVAANPKHIHTEQIFDIKKETLTDFTKRKMSSASEIPGDNYHGYTRIESFKVSQRKSEPSSAQLKWRHKAISSLKAFLIGTYHGRCTSIRNCLNEFCFRFNRRAFRVRSFHDESGLPRHLVACCAKPISTYQNNLFSPPARQPKTRQDDHAIMAIFALRFAKGIVIT